MAIVIPIREIEKNVAQVSHVESQVLQKKCILLLEVYSKFSYSSNSLLAEFFQLQHSVLHLL